MVVNTKLLDSNGYLLDNIRQSGIDAGNTLYDMRQERGYTLEELGIYVSQFWSTRPHRSSEILSGMEKGGAISSTILTEHRSKANRLKQELSDYVSILGATRTEKNLIRAHLRAVDPRFRFMTTSCRPYALVADDVRERLALAKTAVEQAGLI